jgi:RimJ/RimL family protein N-acetyltransferase
VVAEAIYVETVLAAFRSWGWDWMHDGPSRTFAIRDRNGRLIGGCQLKRHDGKPWTVSYWTGASHRGQGIATRSLRLLLLYAADEGITELECHIAENNIPSRRVAEAVGFALSTTSVVEDGEAMVRYRRTLGRSTFS